MSYGALPYDLKWIETASKIYCKYEASICLWSDTFNHMLCEKGMCENERYLISDTLLRIWARISFHSAYYFRPCTLHCPCRYKYHVVITVSTQCGYYTPVKIK